jgi:hypothetical protein
MPYHIDRWETSLSQGVSTCVHATFTAHTAFTPFGVIRRDLCWNTFGRCVFRVESYLPKMQTLTPLKSQKNGRILLVNLLQSSRSTFSRENLLSFFAFKEGMLGTPISVLGGWPTVSDRFLRLIPSNPTATLLEHTLLAQGFMGVQKATFPRCLRPQNPDFTRANLVEALK